jgi:hypothetical protein
LYDCRFAVRIFSKNAHLAKDFFSIPELPMDFFSIAMEKKPVFAIFRKIIGWIAKKIESRIWLFTRGTVYFFLIAIRKIATGCAMRAHGIGVLAGAIFPKRD